MRLNHSWRSSCPATKSVFPTSSKGGLTGGIIQRAKKTEQKPEQAERPKIAMPPDGEWYPLGTIPRDGTKIVVKRIPRMEGSAVEADVYWRKAGGYWYSRSGYRINDEDIVGWRPK